jgi:hypothetical protein
MRLTDSVLGAQTEQGYVATGAVGAPSGSSFYNLSITAAPHTLKMQVKNATGARGTCRYQCQMAILRIAQ